MTARFDRSKLNFQKLLSEIQAALREVESTIKPREVPFLALLGAYPLSPGCILEIGAFKGASTIVLSKAARSAGDDCIWTVDPFTCPCETDPALLNDSSFPEFMENLKLTGEDPFVRVFRGVSQSLANEWSQAIRVLWIDGDHSYSGARQDFQLFSPFLSDGAIVAFHDVLAPQPGPARVFANEVLLSPKFGACGLSGTIGWAQHIKRPEVVAPYRPRKMSLYNSICPHAGARALDMRLPTFQKLRYNFLRATHRQSPSPKQFLEMVV